MGKGGREGRRDGGKEGGREGGREGRSSPDPPIPSLFRFEWKLSGEGSELLRVDPHSGVILPSETQVGGGKGRGEGGWKVNG